MKLNHANLKQWQTVYIFGYFKLYIYSALYVHFYDAFDFIIISRTIIVLIPEASHFRVYIWKFKQQILEYTVTTFFYQIVNMDFYII